MKKTLIACLASAVCTLGLTVSTSAQACHFWAYGNYVNSADYTTCCVHPSYTFKSCCCYRTKCCYRYKCCRIKYRRCCY